MNSTILQTSNSAFLYPTTPLEIINVVSKLKGNKAPRYDDIITPNCQISDWHYSTSIGNASFSQGIFPDALKFAKVVPIFKSDDKSVLSNYRPVSVLSVISKKSLKD